MVRYLYILLALISSASLAQPADSSYRIRKSNIRFGIGVMHVRMIDEGYTDSRLLFRGTNCKLSLAYGRETEKYIFNFAVAGSVGKVESKSGDLPSDYFFLQPSLDYLRATSTYTFLGKENKLFLGVLLSSFNQGIDNEKVIDNISIFSLHGVYFNIFNRLSLSEKQYLQVTYSMPVVVYENRILWNGGASKYTIADTENIPQLLTDNGKFTYFNILNNIQFGLDYVIKGKGTSLRVGYNFLSASSLIESPLHLYSNDLIVELKISL